MTASASVVESVLLMKLKELIREQSEGEWTDEMIEDDAHRFAAALSPLFTPQPAEQDAREALEAEVAALTKALTGLTCGGSEFFIQRGDRFVADIPACVEWVRRSREDAHRRTVEAIKARQAAEALTQAAPGGWRPIETAPKDGDEFQAWWKGAWHPRARFDPEYGSFQLWGRTDFDTEGWEVFEIDGFWQPAPAPPAQGAG